MTIPILPLEVLAEMYRTKAEVYRIRAEMYRISMWRCGLDEKRHFIDLVHDGLGELCSMYYNPRTHKYELEPIKGRP